MSYIQKSLGDGETIIARAHFHALYNVAAWLCLIVPGVLLAFAFGQAQEQPDPYTMAASLLFVLGLITFLRMMIRKWSIEISITSHCFVEKYCLLFIRTNEIALPNIEGVRVRQSLLGRIFSYGTVKIEGTGVESVSTPNIADPVGFVRAIQTAKENITGLTATPKA